MLGDKVSGFSYTNTTASTHTVTPILLGLTSNYALIADNANIASLNNKTCPIDALELIQFRSRDVARVDSNLNIQYPGPVKSGIQYGVRVEETLTTTDTGDASFRVDEPIVLNLSITHPKSGNITGDQITAAFVRLVSTLVKADGSWRFDDLMRSAERPVVD